MTSPRRSLAVPSKEDFAELANQSVRRRRAVTVPRSLDADPHAKFLMMLRANGMPEPSSEYRFAFPRRWRFDYAWVMDAGRIAVALEVDGGIWTKGGGRHTRGSGWLKDSDKLNEACCLGWRLLRCTPQQLPTQSTITLIRRALSLTEGTTP